MAINWKIGFLGTGTMGQYHLFLLKELVRNRKIPKFDLIGCYDSDIKKAIQFSKVHYCRNFQNFEKFIIEGSPNIVYLCTPPFARLDYETVLIERNINYFVEKPPTITGQKELIHLLTTQKLKKIFIQPGFHWRYFRLNEILKDFIKQDKIRIVLGCRLNPLPFQSWRLDKNLSGGPLFERVIHMIDFCQFILGGSLKILSHYRNNPLLNKEIDKKCNFHDSEILIFKIDDILCNISTANYLSGNNILDIKFIGQKNIYKIFLNKQGLMSLQIINKNKIIREFIENKHFAYEKENMVFLLSIFKNKDLGLTDYKKCLELAALLRKVLKN